MDSKNLLDVKHLTRIFTLGGVMSKGELTAVDDVSFNIPAEKPTIVTLAGESGSGKTTVSRLVLGFLKPTSGEIIYQGKNIWKMSRSEWKTYRKEIQAVFQDPFAAFNPLHKADRVLKIPLKRFGLTKSEEETNELISEALETTGLRTQDITNKYPDQLSGGQRQRLMLAKAFLLRPKIIVADEPVSMIDASLRAGILNLMIDSNKECGISYIYITHDLSTARYVSDTIMIMYQGSIMETGFADRIIGEPLHPYSKMLVSSIPVPDPEHRWRERLELPKMELTDKSRTVKGCKFYNRCPERMEKCAEIRPSLAEINNERWVNCHLFQ